jgi:hypothetical protein
MATNIPCSQPTAVTEAESVYQACSDVTIGSATTRDTGTITAIVAMSRSIASSTGVRCPERLRRTTVLPTDRPIVPTPAATGAIALVPSMP